MFCRASLLALLASTLATATPVARRAVDQLNEESFNEAQQRDDTATRALSNVQIKTADGKCLSVDKLSGDFRANLTPIQIADCGSTEGQGWDVITAGKHNDQQGQMLIVSTLTQACFNFDPRRPAGNQVLLFSCGGRADGGGDVTTSQLFAFDGKSSSLSLKPQNGPEKCLVGKAGVVDVADCSTAAQDQIFTFGKDGKKGSKSKTKSMPLGTKPSGSANGGSKGTKCTRRVVTVTNTNTVTMMPPGMIGQPTRFTTLPAEPEATSKPEETPPTTAVETPVETTAAGTTETAPSSSPDATTPAVEQTTTTAGMGDINTTTTQGAGTTTIRYANTTTSLESVTTTSQEVGTTVSQEVTVSSNVGTTTTTSAANTATATENVSATTTADRITTTAPSVTTTASATASGVPVSRAGGTLDPKAVEESHQFDNTAKRDVESVNIRAADGRCLSIDRTAGDFRENLIPVQLAECSEEASQKFDIVTKGKHNDGKAGRALLVSVLTNGCLSFDGRREKGDTVTVFSCGGRADGSGKTDAAQLFPFDAKLETMVLQPASGKDKVCMAAGDGRLDSTQCNKGKEQVFEIVDVL